MDWCLCPPSRTSLWLRVLCVTLEPSGWSLWLRVLCDTLTGAFRLVLVASCSVCYTDWCLQVRPCGFVFCVTLVPSGWSLWLRVLCVTLVPSGTSLWLRVLCYTGAFRLVPVALRSMCYTGAFRLVPVASCSALHWCLQVGPYGFAFCVTLVPSGSSGAFFAGGFSVTVSNAVLGVCGIYSPSVTAQVYGH